ncbi:MAG TPA: glucose-6-phosphate dehydrogenase [Candidatus Limnocylindria bacterium]|nr:glucose-6-phosphate dehydrogenase [Candidatus Limnocylindria bacterium]
MTTHVEAVTPVVFEPKPRQAPPCALVVFGGTGDLARRKLLPALYNLEVGGLLSERFATIGVARGSHTDREYREAMRAAVDEFSRRRPVDSGVWQRFAERLAYLAGSFDDAAAFEGLSTRLQELDRAHDLEGNRLFYLATPPSQFGVILEGLRKAGLIRPPGQGPWTRVIIEKPFGRDLASARELNRLVGDVLDESQTFRIDHYLGKETVQNLLVFRFGNSIFEPLWNRKYVDHVEIAAMETVGVGTRGKFYDQTGVLRDIVQNHLLEVLALVAMEPPNTMQADDVRNEKLKVVRALRENWSDSIDRDVLLGQYRGYRQEPDIATDSTTSTFAALRVYLDNWRWQGVPFYLRAGKQLKKRVTEISIHLQTIPLCLFGREDVCEKLEPNVLTLRIQPDEGIQLTFASKVPGDDLRAATVKMDMSYVETFGGEPPEAYERLLLDAMRGDATLFSRRDWVEASWAWLDPILDHFERQPPRDFPNYEPGSWGPESCHPWIRRDRRTWREL